MVLEIDENAGPGEGTALPLNGVLGVPKLGRAHHKRLRWAFGYGRPVQVAELTGVDLDLIAHQLLARVDRSFGGAALCLTQTGIDYLSQVRQARVAALDVHNSLASRLAEHLRKKGKMTWENLLFRNPKPWAGEEDRLWNEVRPDVFACVPTLQAAKAHPEIYEVKISRSDFLSDVAKPGKRAGYVDLAEAVYFCSPEGVIRADELPDGIGLVCEAAAGDFVIRKRARRRGGFSVHADTLMTMAVKRGQLPGEELDEYG